MGLSIPKTERYYAKDRKAWRKWLEKNHASCPGIWLVYYKKGSGKSRVPYADAVEEALCFGWIDSTMNPIDELCYMQLFTPRKPKSAWSKLNKERVDKLVATGAMTPAGIRLVELAKEHGSWNHLDGVEAFELPEELVIAFNDHPHFSQFYDSISRSNQKMILYYLHTAKRTETKLKRLADLIEAARGNKLPDRFIIPTRKKKNN